MDAKQALKSQIEAIREEKGGEIARIETKRVPTAGELACKAGLMYALRHGNHTYSMCQVLGIYPA